jgi:nucleoside-diphosphate-sugar epimerase
MSRVAVVGASGFLGRELAAFLPFKNHDVTAVTRENYAAASLGHYDVVINAAMPSRRFWAKQHPDLDFVETVQKTADLLNRWHFDRFIQVSSVSARCERHTVYGRHKAAAEVLCDRPDSLVVRLSNLFGPGLTKGAIVDIKNGGPVYLDGESRYAFTNVAYAAGWIAGVMGRYDLTGIMEYGAKNTVALKDIAALLKKDVQFSGPVELQEIENPLPDFPDAREVFGFASSLS